MSHRDASERYSRPAIWLHWSVALPILVMIPAGILMIQEGIPRDTRNTLFLLHKNLGTALIPLIALRVWVRLRHEAPPLPASMPRWQVRAAGLSHGLLYALMIVMPLSGVIRVRAGGFPIEILGLSGAGRIVPRSDALAEWASLVHWASGVMLLAVLALHLGAAAHHGLILRDGVWRRMAPWRR